MSSDLKIEIFAFNVFHDLWYMFDVIDTLPDFLEVYGDECKKVDDYKEAANIESCSVIRVRHLIFKNVYRSLFAEEILKNLKSPMACFGYIIHVCNREDVFGFMTVFERVFATITFVFIMFYRMHKAENTIDVVKYSYVLWVMYFEYFIEEFYARGGWEKLKEAAESYKYLFEFGSFFNRCKFPLLSIRQATANYLTFASAVATEPKHKEILHISILWIQFQITNFDRYITFSVRYELGANSFDAELVLNDLKQTLFPSSCADNNIVISKEKYRFLTMSVETFNSEVSHISEEIKNTDDENKMDKIPDYFSIVESDSAKQYRINSPISELQESTLHITNENENLERKIEENTLTEIDSTKIASNKDSIENLYIEDNLIPDANRNKLSESIKHLTDLSDLDHRCGSKSFENKGEDGTITNVIERNKQEQDIEVKNPVLSSNKTDEKTSSENVSASKSDLDNSCGSSSFENKGEDGTIVNVIERNKQEEDNIEVKNSVLSDNMIDEKTSSENVSAITDFSSANKNVNSDQQNTSIKKGLEDLRKEQNDSEMKNFLQMILVLDDKEGTKLVFSKLQKNTENPEKPQESLNPQGSLNKRKKKSKKKSRK